MNSIKNYSIIKIQFYYWILFIITILSFWFYYFQNIENNYIDILDDFNNDLNISNNQIISQYDENEFTVTDSNLNLQQNKLLNSENNSTFAKNLTFIKDIKDYKKFNEYDEIINNNNELKNVGVPNFLSINETQEGKPRKKRFYLLFVEGTSLQLSYCAYFYYPGYEYYGLYGLTVALAWQLPTKPPSEQIDHLQMITDHFFSMSGDQDINHHDIASESTPPKASASSTAAPPTKTNTTLMERNDSLNKIKFDEILYHLQQLQENVYKKNGNVSQYSLPISFKDIAYRTGVTSTVNGNNNQYQQQQMIRKHFNNKLQNYFYSRNDNRTKITNNNYNNKHNDNNFPNNRIFNTNNNFKKTGLDGSILYNQNNDNDDDGGKYYNSRNPTISNGYWQGHNYWMNPYHKNYNSMWKMSSPNNKDSTNILKNGNQFLNKFSKNDNKDKKKITSTTSDKSNTNAGGIKGAAGAASKNKKNKPTKKKSRFPIEPYIIPIFGKRKKREVHKISHYDKYDLIDINYHRTSRQELYEKLEKFLDQTGQNGTECILKSLCEIGQKEDDTEPVDLFRELLRTIFTLPQPVFKFNNPKHKLYDEAHAYNGDCIKKYPLCPTSVWAE